MLRIVYSYAMMAPSTKERTMAMKKCINILLYAAFFGILAAQRPIQEYSTIHFNIYPIATYYILSVILGTLILLIRPSLCRSIPPVGICCYKAY